MNNKGITLVAMVVTVIVMIILAGVSITLITGDDSSIITEAEKSVYKNSITQIEEKINEFYINNYNDMPELRNKAISLILYYEMDKYTGDLIYEDNWVDASNLTDTMFHKENQFYTKIDTDTDKTKDILTDKYQFWSNSETSLFELSWEKTLEYDGEEKTFYLLNTKNLTKMFGEDVKILDLNTNYETLNEVYAITADLRVFYLPNGELSNAIGIDPADIQATDNNRIVFEAGSEIANNLNDGKEMTVQQVKVHKQVSIDSNSTITTLKDIGKLSSMQELIINNEIIESLEGIENAESLKVLRLYGNKLESFKGIDKCINLEKIYLHDFSDEQFKELCTAMKNTNYTKLKVFAAVGYWHDHYSESYTDERYVIPKIYASGIVENKNMALTNISPLSYLTSKTKASIDTFLLNNNAITDASVLSGFSNIKYLKIDGNNLTTLNGIANHSKMIYLRVAGNKLVPNALDVLKDSAGNATLPKLTTLDLRGNFELQNVNAVSTCTKLTKLFFKSDTSLNRNDNDVKLNTDQVREIKDFLNALGSGLQIDAKYSLALLSETSTIFETKDETMSIEAFQNLAYAENIIYLSISNLKLLNENGTEITSAEEYTRIISETLSNLTRVRYLQLYNLPNLNSVNFVTNMKTLVELDVRKCNKVVDFTCLNSSTLNVTKLAIDNLNVDLTTIQTAINRMGKTVYKVDENGDIVYKNGVAVTDSRSYWSKGYGLVLCHYELYSQLPKCTNLTRLMMHRSWEGDTTVIAAKGIKNSKAISVDLSNLTKLEYFYSYAIYCKYILPENVTYVSYSYVTTTSYGAMMDLSKCKKIKEIHTSVPNAKSVIISSLNTVPKDNNVEILSLNQQRYLTDLSFLSRFKNVKVLDMVSSSQQIMQLTDISALSNATNLEEFNLSYAPNIKELPSLANLSNLKTISVTNSGLESITDSVNLRKLTNLTKLDFNINNILKIDGLIPNEDTDFENLEYLNLENNCLENKATYDDYTTLEYNVTTDIFVPLNLRKLRNLYVANNPNYTNTAALKTLTWTGKSGF